MQVNHHTVVPIVITGIQYPPEGTGEDAVTTVQKVEAEFFNREDVCYLFYTEQQEGFPGPWRTRVKLKKDTLEICRRGQGGSTLVFTPGQSCRTEYPTPYGTLFLDIVTAGMKVSGRNGEEGVHSGWPDVVVEYLLQNNGEDVARYQLSLCVDKGCR